MKCYKCGSNIPSDSDSCVHCGSFAPDDQYNSPTWFTGREIPGMQTVAFAPGDYLGDRYEITAEIGRGGMGKIFKARDEELDIFVAIKMIHPELLTNPNTVIRLKKELLMAREISHENVVRIHDFFDAGETKFISMQYVEGKNLAELIRDSGPLDTKTAVNIFKQLCRGLKAAHNQGIIHRDLKPQNILVDQKGKVYISDFGLAKSLEDKGMSMSGIVMGTPQYLSPEQAMGENLDQRSDIYNLGIIMYEMLTGQELFSSETVLGYLQKHIREKPTSPSAINTRIPPFLEKIILKCLQKNRERRYGDVEEILKDLEREKASTAFFYPGKIKKIAKISAAAVLILAAVLALYLIFGKGNRGEPPPPPPPGAKSVAVLYFQNDTGKPELDHWRRALATLLITDLAQSPLLQVLPEAELYQIMEDMEQLENTRYSPLALGQIAARANVDHLILGNYTKAGDTFSIGVKILEVRREKWNHLPNVQGKEEHFFALVDDLTKNIKKRLAFTGQEIKTDIDKEIGQITTTSPEALKHYVEGKMCVNEGNYREGIEYLEKAVKIDAQFAMAYRDMAWAYAYLKDTKNQEKYLLKTMALRDHISPRERYLIEGDYYSWYEDSYEKSIAAYKELLKIYPQDNEVNQKLGMSYYFIHRWDEAIQRFEECRKNNDSSFQSYMFLAGSYMGKGEYRKARAVLNDYRRRFSENSTLYRYSHYSYTFEGKIEKAQAELEKAISLDPDNPGLQVEKGKIYQLRGDLKEAEQKYREVHDKKDAKDSLTAVLYLSNLYLQQGRFRESLKTIREGVLAAAQSDDIEMRKMLFVYLAYAYLKTGSPKQAIKAADRILAGELKSGFRYSDRLAQYFKALAYFDMNAVNEAVRAAEELKLMVEKGIVKDHIKFYYHLLGIKALKNHHFVEAAVSLKKSLLWPCRVPGSRRGRNEQSLFLDSLAYAYFLSGDDDNALKYYEKILSLPTGRLYYGDIYTRSYYWLAKIYQRKGSYKKAREYYEKFILLWDRADPGIRELEDAEKQLRLLKKTAT